ncbi:c-type cytochrome [Paraburkholderia gardini]|uniref:Alcohol dehydrogenase (Quinone), cytochrome c subunit n=1 Tax=Paraburkholderia gardini TaxID=2823469 RepID=A0ABM8U957_9BURK|nr:Alcohol dehydrogenase (quinone), cytochrome c subunit [Paraburkholderia gardini]
MNARQSARRATRGRFNGRPGSQRLRVVVVVAVGCAAVFACMLGASTALRAAQPAVPLAGAGQAVPDQALIARGAYLAKAADCAGCHTAAPTGGRPGGGAPPAPFAGGLGMASPFGTIYTSNITPDPVNGIGRYTYDDFARALRKGIAPGGKRLYPAMPFPSFAKIDDDDMRALYAYFMHGVKPVAQPTPPTRLPFPFSQRWALMLWDWAFVPNGQYVSQPGRDAQWNRGAYLVQSLGHCGACHTPRGPAYEERGYDGDAHLYLTGGTNDHWFAPNLTGDPGSGLGRVPSQDLAAFLRSGHGGGLITFGSMVQVVEDSTQYLNDNDLDAIAAYLKSLPPREPAGLYDSHSRAARQTVQALHTGDVERPGAGVFQSYCARCHQSNGLGVAQKYPRLAGNPAVLAPQTTSLVRLLVEGGASPHTENGPPSRKMPSFADRLSSEEMAQVLTFIRNTWGNSALPVTTRDVTSVRSAIHK